MKKIYFISMFVLIACHDLEVYIDPNCDVISDEIYDAVDALNELCLPENGECKHVVIVDRKADDGNIDPNKGRNTIQCVNSDDGQWDHCVGRGYKYGDVFINLHYANTPQKARHNAMHELGHWIAGATHSTIRGDVMFGVMINEPPVEYTEHDREILSFQIDR